MAAVVMTVALFGGASACGGSGTAPGPQAPTAGSSAQATKGSASHGTSGGSTSVATGTGSAGKPAGPPGGPVPAGFRPTDVTFVSPSDGWAIGPAPCGKPPCTSVVRTRDGGRTWVGIPAPRAELQGLRFASETHGFAFAPESPGNGDSPNGAAVYETTDGGASWRPVALTEQTGIRRVEPGAGGTYGLTDYGAKPNYLERFVNGRMQGVDGTQLPSGESQLAVHGSNVFVVAARQGSRPTFLALTGGAVRRSELPCPPSTTAVAVAASGDRNVVAACGAGPGAGQQAKTVLTTADAGATWTTVGAPPSSGYVGSVAAVGSGTFLTGARSPVRVTRDAGRTWTVSWNGSGGAESGDAGYLFVGFTDASHGVAVPASGQSREIDLTDDGGRSWRVSRFR